MFSLDNMVFIQKLGLSTPLAQNIIYYNNNIRTFSEYPEVDETSIKLFLQIKNLQEKYFFMILNLF